MTAQEIREYQLVSKKLVEVEEKTKLLADLKKRKVCLGEEEVFFKGEPNRVILLEYPMMLGVNLMPF